MENTKQVIILRKELGMRRGKEISQGCHASMAFLTKNLHYDGRIGSIGYVSVGEYKTEIDHWLKNSFRKLRLLRILKIPITNKTKGTK
jgi:PTH2 family peptidyl-tRNA hydrolase